MSGTLTLIGALKFFSPEMASVLENLYDSGGLENRSSLPGLCNAPETQNS